MDKDTSGSPVTDDGLFPLNGIAGEIDYRGELDFWRQAISQKDRCWYPNRAGKVE
jgi:hypothetical protein